MVDNPKTSQYGNQRDLTLIREELELKLRDAGINSPSKEREVRKNKDLILELRRAKKFETKTYSPSRQQAYPTFQTIEAEIQELSGLNQKIERQIKLEILGIQDKPFPRLMFNLGQLYDNLRGKPQEPAEVIITSQINKVAKIAGDLDLCKNNIDNRLRRLESYYEKQFLTLLDTHQKNQDLRKSLEEKTELLSQTREIAENTEDFQDKLIFTHAHRKLRRNISSGVYNIKSGNKLMLTLQHELPMLDNLSSICEAYSNALEETSQEAHHMGNHLENVISLYLHMMRSHKVDMNLSTEARELFTYTNNMSNALRNGTINMVKAANDGNLFEKEYGREAISLDIVLDGIENSQFNKFHELEHRMNKYLTKSKEE